MLNIEKWVTEHESGVEEAFRYRCKIAKHVRCPIENLFFTFIQAIIADVKEAQKLQKENQDEQRYGTTVHLANPEGGGSVINHLMTADRNVEDLRSHIRQLELRASKDRARRTTVTAIPIPLPITSSDILVNNINISKEEIPFTHLDKNITVVKLILADGSYVNIDDFTIAVDQLNPSIGRINYSVSRVVAKRNGTGVMHYNDLLTGFVDFKSCKISLVSSTGSTTAVVFSGSLVVDKP